MTRMAMWTVYDHPRDFPNNYVAREWIAEDGRTRPTGNFLLANDIEVLREILLAQMHLHRLPRSESDDPKIVETWI
jgi:hypothetical protein